MRFFLRKGDEERGPYDEESLEASRLAGRLSGATMVRREDSEVWTPLDQALARGVVEGGEAAAAQRPPATDAFSRGGELAPWRPASGDAFDPYRPPAHHGEPVPMSRTATGGPIGTFGSSRFVPATIGSRLGARTVDGVLVHGFSLFAAEMLSDKHPALENAERVGEAFAGRIMGQLDAAPATFLALLILGLPVSLIQWALIARRGQTIGKLLFRIRIVRQDGSRPGFLRGVVAREWAVGLFAFARSPFGLLLGLLDVLLGLRSSLRCLHDEIGGTEVVAEGELLMTDAERGVL